MRGCQYEVVGHNGFENEVKQTTPGTTTQEQHRHLTFFYYDLYGNLTTVFDTDGKNTLGITQHTYDLNGRLRVSTTDSHNNTSLYFYDAVGRSIVTMDPLGFTTQVAYDDSDRPIQVVDALGAITKFTYNDDGQLLERTAPDGGVWSIEYGSARDVVSGALAMAWTSPSGSREQAEYDAVGNLVALRDSLGNRTIFSYDGLRRQTAVESPLRARMQTDYDGVGNKVRTVSPKGHKTHYRYDALGRITSIKNPLGQFTTIDYLTDEENPLYRQIGASGNVTDRFRVTKRSDGHGLVTETETNSRGLVVKRSQYDVDTPEDKRVTHYRYDTLGQLTQITDPQGYIGRFQYDRMGNVTLRFLVDPAGAIVTHTAYEYDARGLVTQVTDALGNTTQYAYDANGRLTATTDSLGYQDKTTYNSVGQVIQQENPLGDTTRYSYDKEGHLVRQVDGEGDAQVFRYDRAGNLLSRRDLRGNTWEFHYDAMGGT